mmetsp:Transcript_72409/g.141907  ORF Transcript_72409/g.141907 Transcript_72409/m.141907 type:complete len:215 (+) Transcript_72409:234-878(+)
MWSGVSPSPLTTARSASCEIRSNASAVKAGDGRLPPSSVLSFSPSGLLFGLSADAAAAAFSATAFSAATSRSCCALARASASATAAASHWAASSAAAWSRAFLSASSRTFRASSSSASLSACSFSNLPAAAFFASAPSCLPPPLAASVSSVFNAVFLGWGTSSTKICWYFSFRPLRSLILVTPSLFQRYPRTTLVLSSERSARLTKATSSQGKN